MSGANTLTIEQLHSLIDINARLNSNYSDIDALLVHILESAMRFVNCESSSLLLVNADNETLRFVYALGPKGAEVKDIVVSKSSIAGWVVENNKSILIENVSTDPRFSRSVQDKTGYVTRNMIAVPMCVKGKCIGVIEVLNKIDSKSFTKNDLLILETFSNQAGIAYSNANFFKSAQDKISVLSSKIANGAEYHSFIAKSSSIKDLLKIIDEVGKTNTTILITGESGVGKELFAEQIHVKSSRKDKPFIRVNCAALSSALLETELFGHVKGAFTDAVSDRIGRFEAANGGTLFLDEIGELPVELQVKLLRVLQEHKFEKVGSNKTISVDVRIVAATNRNLEKMVAEGTFRSDLYFRLNVVPLNVPPLRDRKDDIEPLASFFLKKFSLETKKNFIGFSQNSMKMLYSYFWPGNIRELENSIERACVLGTPPFIQAEDFRLNVKIESEGTDSGFDSIGMMADDIYEMDQDKTLKTALNRFKAAYLKKVLSETSWNQTEAGKILGIQRTYVNRLLNELHIR